MKKFLINATVAAVVGLTGLTGGASVASADSLVFEIGPGVDMRYRDRDRWGDERDWRRDRWDRGERWGGRRGRCVPGLAIEKARDRGLRRAHIADISRRQVVVAGRRHGDRQAIIFANVRGCPIIGRW
ncbi:hypothetical protein [Ensifer sp. LCM 4579]|uniref:hypothetical protein n=1 Tax=Ensifer sp. LCM 4579 TaxID=1848292 RepID=UPI0008DACB4F|nr:hypothetical protein [Ensifer sp. LCM 4579]OHV82457.1 hypothetical protein LCM4579_18015 [Ensifer sp. LCM 4579]